VRAYVHRGECSYMLYHSEFLCTLQFKPSTYVADLLTHMGSPCSVYSSPSWFLEMQLSSTKSIIIICANVYKNIVFVHGIIT
jgi:hypothetical protein